MIFIYKTYLPSRVKCLMKMGGSMITPRKLKHAKFQPPIYLKSDELPKNSSLFIDSAKICLFIYLSTIYFKLNTNI